MSFRFTLLSLLVSYNLSVDAQAKTLEQGSQDETEVITVKGNRYAINHFEELNTTNSKVELVDLNIAPDSVLDAITDLPGISENGQAGLFQVYSIRGLSRQRVLTYIDHIPLKSERRAGIAMSFLHPMLFENVEAIRGPASTVFLSGSLGGTIKLTPKFFKETQLMLGYDFNGNRNHQLLGTGADDWSLGFGRQSSDKSKDVNGNLLNDAYDQYSASFIREWSLDNYDISWATLASYGENIGRSSTRFPDRIITVPVEKHLLSQLSVEASDWIFGFYMHPNKVKTKTIRPNNRENLVTNESDDLGLSFKRLMNFSDSDMQMEWGIDYLYRFNINGSDQKTTFSDNAVDITNSLLNGRESELGAYFTLSNYLGKTKWQLGSRLITHSAKNNGFAAISENAITGFAGLSYPIYDDLFVTANLGTGVRFPTVSELFFSGTTGRGEVVGNPNLDHETSLSFDLGLKYRAPNRTWAFNLYQQDIKNYIERVEVAPELLSFKNLRDGSIQGLEFESSFNVKENLALGFSFSVLEGKDSNNNPLIDIPANRLNISSLYQFENLNWKTELEYRHHKSNVASGEQATSSALIVNTGVDYQLNPDLTISVSIDNLFDEIYYRSQDELVPLAEGRSFGFSLNWLLP